MSEKGGAATSRAGIPSSLKWHGDGGKSYLASRIVALMPKHLHYVEPFAGGLSVLFAKNPADTSEVVNDLDGNLTNFWTILQHKQLFAEFHRRIQAVPFSQMEWADAHQWLAKNPAVKSDNVALPLDINRAIAFFICCRQSLAGRMEAFAPLSRTRTRRGMNEQAAAWLSVIEGLPAVHERLKRVVILNRNALEVIAAQDGPETLFYLDPPYTPDSRASPDVYRHEMTRQQHVKLLEVLASLKGKFVLSGYANPDYDSYSERLGWQRVEWDLPNNSAGGKNKRRMVEVVWCNFPTPAPR